MITKNAKHMARHLEISPAILAKTESEFQEKVDKVRALGLKLHIDVMDGNFVPQVAWADPSAVEQIVDDLEFEVHLMVANPEHAAIVWLSTSAQRVWIHAESTKREEMIFRSAPKEMARIGLAINPKTPISRISHYLDSVSAILVMGVNPGKSGQEFQRIAIEKVEQLKELRPHLWIKVDGGVNEDTIKALADAGADQIAAASALTDQPNVTEALMRLQRAVDPEASPVDDTVYAMFGDQDVEIPETPTKSLEDQLRDLVMDKAAPASSDMPLNADSPDEPDDKNHPQVPASGGTGSEEPASNEADDEPNDETDRIVPSYPKPAE